MRHLLAAEDILHTHRGRRLCEGTGQRRITLRVRVRLKQQHVQPDDTRPVLVELVDDLGQVGARPGP
ncbi:MAG TPA: hypothetical protein VIU44_01375, partial [Gaiellaceae bacterium]